MIARFSLAILALGSQRALSLPAPGTNATSTSISPQIWASVVAGKTDVTVLDVLRVAAVQEGADDDSVSEAGGSVSPRSIYVRVDDDSHSEGSYEDARDPISEQDWKLRVDKGAQYVDWLAISDLDALDQALSKTGKFKKGHSQSVFTKYPKDFKDNGWVKHHVDATHYDFTKDILIKEVLQGLGVSTTDPTTTEAGGNVIVDWRQTEKHFNGKDHGRATQGQCLNIYNVKEGVLVLQYNYSPATMDDMQGKSKDSKLAVPELHQLSDLLFLEWSHQAAVHHTSVNKLQYVLQQRIQTPETLDVLDKILKDHGLKMKEDSEWELTPYTAPAWKQKISLRRDTEAFNAVMGTVNSASIVWLLLQHRLQLGPKQVSSIDIYKDPGKDNECPSLVFVLEDVDGKKQVGESSRNGKGAAKKIGKSSGAGAGGKGATPGSSKNTFRRKDSVLADDSLFKRETEHVAHSLAERSDYSPPSESDDEDDYMDVDEDEEVHDPGPGDEDAEMSEEDEGPPPLITDQEFATTARKGEQFFAWMADTNIDQVTAQMRQAKKIGMHESSQSKFKDSSAFKENGWSMNKDYNPEALDFNDYPWKDVLTKLGLSTTAKTKKNPKGDNNVCTWNQDQDVFNGKPQDTATNGEFNNIYNTRQGVIIAQWNYSPAYKLQQTLEEHHMKTKAQAEQMVKSGEAAVPELRSLSDVQFLDYARFAAQNKDSLKTLRYIMRPNCQTRETNQIIDHILKKKGAHEIEQTETETASISRYRAPSWDQKITLTHGSDEFNAVLGTNNGASGAYLLLQHKHQLGFKRISKIHIFQDSVAAKNPKATYQGPCMIFEIEDLDAKGRPVASKDEAVVAGPSNAKGGKGGGSKGGKGSGIGGKKGVSDAGVSKSKSDSKKKGGESKPGSSKGGSRNQRRLTQSESGAEIVKRTPRNFNQCATRGRKIWNAFRDSSGHNLDRLMQEAGLLQQGQPRERPYRQDLNQLKASGWSSEDNPHLDFDNTPAIRKTLADLKLSSKETDYAYVEWEHKNKYRVAGSSQTEEPTGAQFVAAYNTKDGVIINTWAFSPKHEAVRKGDTFKPMPFVAHQSDMLAIEYNTQAISHKQDPENLKFFISVALDEETETIVESILQRRKPKTKATGPLGKNQPVAPKWPGIKLDYEDADPQDFYAVHGSPQGTSVPMLLLQHREIFGAKFIRYISIFSDERWEGKKGEQYQGASVVFHLKGVLEHERLPDREWEKGGSSSG